ncbi:MAG: type II toxin-antitoxin system HipA family toxin [Lachnospiraceae bacterium]|nr:type II toxin-antitoxin system HipA family toxin [Lachnospiraceae bacterium]
MEYLVSIDIMGKPVLVGRIAGADSGSARFRYDRTYLSEESSRPISLSLPLQEEPFPADQTKAFFDGLLPEGFTRRAVAGFLHLNENDYLEILYHLGRECIGALRIYTEGESVKAGYEKLSVERMRQLAAEGASDSAALLVESRLSLAGASGKVGAYRDPVTHEWYLPHGTAPSTHIVKQSHVRLKQIVQNELLCLLTAKYCGIDIPETFIINQGSGRDEEILLASERFDRRIPEEPQIIDGMAVPLRLHQEDFGEALGIPSAEKYEHGRRHLKEMFTLLRIRSARPVEDQIKLWDRIVFNYLIGNTDGHLKNYSILYSEDLRSIRLAPAYDIINTTGYPGMTHEMAFSIGNAGVIEDVTENSFREAAKEAGLGEALALDRVDSMTEKFRPALTSACEDLVKQGFSDAERIKDVILRTGGIRQITGR